MKLPFILRPKGDPQVMQGLLQAIAQRDAEKTYKVTIEIYHKNKTQEQLGYYYGAWIPSIQKWLEESKGIFISNDELDAWLKDEYLDSKIVTIGGKTKKLKKSLSNLNSKEMNVYMERIDQHCAERGLILPPPRI